MSQKQLPRRVDFIPTSEAPTSAASSEIVMVTRGGGRLMDRDPQCEERPETLIEAPQDKGNKKDENDGDAPA